MDGNYDLNVQPIQTIVAMKKILSVFCIATLLFASCSDEYDDSKLWQNVNDLKDRIASLEKTVQTMNSDIGSIQSIIDAINARDYIVKVEELADRSGYNITFAKGNTITIKHGKDGIDGKDSPIIGIDIYEGIYYWTITTNGNKTWLLDNDGNKLKVSGVDGKTAYDLAVDKGYKGTLEEWLESLKGSDGQNGSNGKSAYDLAVEKGYTGTLEEWLLSLNGTNGSNGKSAYELAVEKGYKGTLDQWLESLKGSNGQHGSNGKSAYDLAVENGYSGTIEEWLESLNGTNGKDGSNGSDGESGKDGITPILGIDSDGYWTIDMGNGVQRLKDANGNDVKAIGQDGSDGKNGNDGDSFFSNVTYDENAVYFTLTDDGKVITIPLLSQEIVFTIENVTSEQLFEYGKSKQFNIIQKNISKISISKPDGWKVSVQGDVLTVTAPVEENTFAEESGEIAITAMGTDSKSFIMFSFAVKVEPYIQFKDPKFEEYILANFDKDGNGFISQLEAYEITEIDCSGLGITCIDEIKYFPNLAILNCHKNKIKTLDISLNQQLKKLNCNNNLLTNLNVNYNPNLIYANFNGQNTEFGFEVGTYISYNSHKGIAFLKTYSDSKFPNWNSRMIALEETTGDHTTYMNLANNPTYSNYTDPMKFPLIPITELHPVKNQVNSSLQFLGKPIISGIYWYNGWDRNYGWDMDKGTYTVYSSSTINKIRLSYSFPFNYN